MRAKPKFKKSSLLPQKERDKLLINASQKANLLITICILADCEGRGKKRINRFLDNYNILLDSYNAGNEDIHKISDIIYERFGIKIM